MKALSLFILFVTFQTAFANPENVTMLNFIEAHKGKYEILTANNVKPKPDAARASVELDGETKECILTFPYCLPNGTCDPGYLIFDCAKTQVIKNKISGPHEVFTIVDNSNGKQKRYTWEQDGDRVLFSNHQYVMPPENQVITLEHVARKINED